MKRIEFIGPPGAGKTTLFKVVKNLRDNEGEILWSTPEEARRQIRESKNYFPKGKKALLKRSFYTLTNNKKQKEKFLDLCFINHYKNDVFYKTLPRYNPYIDILIKHNANLVRHNENLQREPHLKAKMIGWFLEKRLLLDLAFLAHFEYEKYVVYDDGIIHNNNALSKRELFNKVFNNNSIKNIESLKPEAIIFCKITSDECARRRLKRINEGKGTFIGKSLKKSELKSICATSLEKKERTVENFKALNTPILTLNMEENLQENAVIVKKYINRLIQNRNVSR